MAQTKQLNVLQDSRYSFFTRPRYFLQRLVCHNLLFASVTYSRPFLAIHNNGRANQWREKLQGPENMLQGPRTCSEYFFRLRITRPLFHDGSPLSIVKTISTSINHWTHSMVNNMVLVLMWNLKSVPTSRVRVHLILSTRWAGKLIGKCESNKKNSKL